jgi:hypothetical protein
MKKINRFKIFFLFLNASSYKLADTGRYKDGIYNESQVIALILIWCIEFAIFRLLSLINRNVKLSYAFILLGVSFIFHLGIDILFKSDLKLIGGNYQLYYGKYVYYIFCFIVIMAVIYTINYLLN